MPGLAIDVSYARPDPVQVARAGYVAVWRYYSGGDPKDLTPAEAQAWLATGVGIGLVWETTGQRALDGAAAGQADARAALDQAHSVGQPIRTPLLANIGDFAATAAQLAAVGAYYDAFAQLVAVAGYQPGGYGTGFIIDSLAASGRTGLWWQNAMDDAGTPGSVVSAHAAVYQRVTPTRTIAGTRPGDFDEDVLLVPIAFWSPDVTPPAAADPPGPASAGTPVQIGAMTVQAIPFSCTLDANGWTALDVAVPAGIGPDQVVSVVMDWASAYDPGAWHKAVASVDYEGSPAGHVRIVVSGDPGRYFTGRVVIPS